MSTIELLAPVGHREGLLAAVTNGADAIYVGGAAFGARKEAAFTNEELIEVIKFSHLHNVKVYVTVNTTIFDQELEALKEKAKKLGIKNAHNMKKETLIAKIEEAKAGEGQNPEGE